MKHLKYILPIGFCLALSACGLPPAITALSYAIEGVSYAASGKSMTDHALSAAASQDCAMFRVVQGQEVCRNENAGEGNVLLAMADETADGADGRGVTPAGGPALYSFGAGSSGEWRIAVRAEVAPAASDTALPAGRAPGQPALIRADGAPVALNPQQISAVSGGLPKPGSPVEIFALLQDNGTLEIFAYDSRRRDDQEKLVLMTSIAGYAENPAVFLGIGSGDSFIAVADLIV